MQNIVPEKLKAGDEIRVIAPSTSIKIIGPDCRQIAKERFEALGLKVRFGKNTTDDNFDLMASSDLHKRAEDIMEAFEDKNVKAIFTIIGGYNSNQVLPFLDYDIIRRNPKIICGYSDITALLNAIRSRTGMVTFYGPHYSSIGMKHGNEYTLAMLRQMLFEGGCDWQAAAEWSDDLWFIDQEKREFVKNDGWRVLHSGEAEGHLEGGNLQTLFLLSATPYQPVFTPDTILVLEDCFVAAAADAKCFMNRLQSLAQREDFGNVRALLIGRFQKESDVSREKLDFIINHIPQLKNLPVIADMDFGHTTPISTLPLGGHCVIKNGQIKLSW